MIQSVLPLLIAPFVGSFLGVVVKRLPEGRPIALARSTCNHHGEALAVRA
jgi:leader peptidase (prepilin peptidase) / N-methyltransferase